MPRDPTAATNPDGTKPSAPQPSRPKRPRIPPLSISFNKGEEDLRDEFFRQLDRYAKDNHLSGKPNQSDFLKHLLYQALYPDDRPDTPTIQALLQDLKTTTDKIGARLRTLEDQHKKMGNTIAEGVGFLLIETGKFTPEKVKEWLDKRLGIKTRNNDHPAG